jgi:hypothetical protein
VPIINNCIKNFLVFVIALQVLNMSIDVPSAQSNVSSHDFNYIDTYVEYIAEVILKYKNAIPESKHRHQRELQLHKHIQVICEAFQITAIDKLYNLIRKPYGNYSDKYASTFIKEIHPPPPKKIYTPASL